MTRVAGPLRFAVALLFLAWSAVADEPPDRLNRLADWLTGTFSSAAQAAREPAFEDVTAHLTPIWSDREDGVWLYLEQSLASAPDQPYRQRVLHLTHIGHDLYEVRVFELPAPKRAVGAWRDSEVLTPVSPEGLDERSGCEVVLRDLGDAFVGSTLDSLCPSSRAGAVCATSQVRIGPDGLETWDRGFAADGSQVWGSETGPYRLRRVVPRPEDGPGAKTAGDEDAGAR